MKIRALTVVLLVAHLSGCATTYKSYGTLGGYQDKRISADRYSIRYEVNGKATKLSLQTYWLYRAAELTVANGFDGFEIASPIEIRAHRINHTLLASQDGGLPYRLSLSSQFVSMGSGFAPDMVGEISLLREPFEVDPPNVFNARRLLSDLRPYVEGPKCQADNVCAHEPRYLAGHKAATK